MGTVLEPTELNAAMPGTLVRLNVKQMPAERAWVNGRRAYLHGPRSRDLRQLYLKFQSAGAVTETTTETVTSRTTTATRKTGRLRLR